MKFGHFKPQWAQNTTNDEWRLLAIRHSALLIIYRNLVAPPVFT
jgi:hypothetical protein